MKADIKIEKEDPGLNSDNGFQASANTATESALQGQTELVNLVNSGTTFLESVVENDPQAKGLENGEYI